MARILSIYVDPDTCTCSEACVFECQEALEIQDGFARVREGAEKYFETHVKQIKAAADACPVAAITLEVKED